MSKMMKFQPFSSKYDFAKADLSEKYPSYLLRPISQWIHDLVEANDLGYAGGAFSSTIATLKPAFTNQLNAILRDDFPMGIKPFLEKIHQDPELTSNFLALMLQNYADGRDAIKLETILAEGGSAFAVRKVDKDASIYDRGVYNLVKRVPEVVSVAASSALSSSAIIASAWSACYSRNPDYEKTVNKCCDALEHLLRDAYEPKNVRPQLGLLLKNLQSKPEKLEFKGDTILENKADLLNLIRKATTVRGSHTAGTGRPPTQYEAEFILHATILIWQLHQGVKSS